MHVSGEVRLKAKPDRVWRYVTDPSHFPDFVSGWAHGSARGTGPEAELRWTAKVGPLSLRATERVVEWTENRRVAFEGEMAGVPFRSSMSLGPADDDTRLRVDVDYRLPRRRGGGVGERLLRPVVSAGVCESLDRLGERFGAAAPATADHALTPDEVVELYRERAAGYDRTVRLYEWLGFDTDRYRIRAADALSLEPGDTVVEVGCGTGLNLPLLRERVGPTGRVIGVDLTDAMLEVAARRVREHGWDNVDLVCTDAARYAFPPGVDGIVSTLALTLSPDYDAIIAAGASALAPGGRWVILDLKHDAGWPDWLVALGLATMRPFGVALGAAERHPWESLRKHLPHTSFEELYFGAAYLAWGEKARLG
jgi:demethylmenaquinone methyltransferase/2-methoxy-6-polyprenyl-1,4-benzoquinol methylase